MISSAMRVRTDPRASPTGYPQRRGSALIEPPVVTSGDELVRIGEFLAGRTSYDAGDVLDYLMSS